MQGARCKHQGARSPARCQCSRCRCYPEHPQIWGMEIRQQVVCSVWSGLLLVCCCCCCSLGPAVHVLFGIMSVPGIADLSAAPS